MKKNLIIPGTLLATLGIIAVYLYNKKRKESKKNRHNTETGHFPNQHAMG